MNSTAKTVTFDRGKPYSLDRYGFLDPPDQWDEDFANDMARLQGVYDGLTEEHWAFIHYIARIGFSKMRGGQNDSEFAQAARISIIRGTEVTRFVTRKSGNGLQAGAPCTVGKLADRLD